MIIVFSGTGNSLLVAHELQKHLGGEVTLLEGKPLIEPHHTLLTAPEGEPVVWVMPVYSWGVPQVMEAFMRLVKFKGAHEATHYLVMTCGDDIGYADNCWRKIVGRRGWTPAGSFSVAMPNTYVLMKGFDTDSPSVAEEKLAAMPARVAEVAAAIQRRFNGDDVVRGSWARVKTSVIRPWFNLMCTSPKPFRCVEEKCEKCGLCSRECPMENIAVASTGYPRWGSRCALCLRCYHICPSHAVAYGKQTEGKGQKRVFRLPPTPCAKQDT